MLKLLESGLGLLEVLAGGGRLRVELQIDADDVGVVVRQLSLSEKENRQAGFRELFSHFLHLRIVLLEPGGELHQALPLVPAGVEERVEDLDHVGVFIHAELVLEVAHDLLDAVLFVPEVVSEVF